MAVLVGVATPFQATLQDNGNYIDLPVGSVFAWSTDDDTDQIQIVTPDTRVIKVTVVNPPANRTTITVTASTTAPDGTTVSGSATTDIVAGVTHTYTVVVGQLVAQPK